MLGILTWAKVTCHERCTLTCRPAHAVHFAVYEAAQKGWGETVAETFQCAGHSDLG